MKYEAVLEAKKVAEEFIEKVNELIFAESLLQIPSRETHYTSPKHRGAVKRRSMDLTRALAEMRKPGE